MLEISEQRMSLPLHRAPRAAVSSLAVVRLRSLNSRTFGQPFAILLESRRSKIRGKASLQTRPFAAAQSNSFRMKLLYKSQNNFRSDNRPGRIVSQETLLESADSAENRSQKPAKNKSLRITSLYKRKNNCPGITLLQKNVGGGGPGRTS
jgi:hypothetical protein